MPAAYEICAAGDVKNKKQSMTDLKLQRLNELKSQHRLSVSRHHANTRIDSMPAAYEIHAGGDMKNKKQSMADLYLRRLFGLKSRLRIPVILHHANTSIDTRSNSQ